MRKDFKMLESYLSQSGASPGLSMAIQKQVRAKFKQTAMLKLGEVKCLGVLGNYLREALWSQACLGGLSLHPFWSAWSRIDTSCLISFCKSALDLRSLAQGDVIFEEGQHG